MGYIFTDYNQMVGKRPRQAYWKELQDAIQDINNKLEGDGMTILITYRPADKPIYDYPKGITTFSITEDGDGSGYPTKDGVVETIHIDDFRNIQHFFDYTGDDNNGLIYYRQWKPLLGQWTNWGKLLTDLDLMKHADDDTKHIQSTDRVRLDGYIHYQPAQSMEWAVSHNMNKYPNVQVVDSAGNVMMCDVQHISKYELKLKFAVPFQGTAYLS